MTLTLERPAPTPQAAPKKTARRKRSTSLFANGEPLVWLTGGAMALALAMIVGLLALVLVQGGSTFWPRGLVQIETLAGKSVLGEINAQERYEPAKDAFEVLPASERARAEAEVAARGKNSERRMLREENFEFTGEHYRWVSDFEITRESVPEWALTVERSRGGRFYGFPVAFTIDGEAKETDPEKIWTLYQAESPGAHERAEQRRSLETKSIGALNAEQEAARLSLRKVELASGKSSAEFVEAQRRSLELQQGLQARYEDVSRQIAALDAQNARQKLVLRTADGQQVKLSVADVVRAFPANRLSMFERLGVYFSRWWEFLSADPRESNSEGGVFPAIFGTVLMTMIMSLLVVPFGVLAALYLREYAKPGFLVSTVRIAVNNLAGVPSIVFGVFGLGFFCYTLGSGIDKLFFSERMPSPTFGKGGILWAALTLALLTLPVVIVATEEALSSVPGSMREGSYACGATKWQTIQRIVLPRALPGIMTGMILAIARGAGEVAPLMLVGAAKLAPALAIDTSFPYLHPERSFLHLGFQIYDLGFQSPNSEAAKPMVFTTTLLLIAIIIMLNLSAIWVRGRLRQRFSAGQF